MKQNILLCILTLCLLLCACAKEPDKNAVDALLAAAESQKDKSEQAKEDTSQDNASSEKKDDAVETQKPQLAQSGIVKPQQPSADQPTEAPPTEDATFPSTTKPLYGVAFLGYESHDVAITPPYAYITQDQFKKMESVMYDGDEYFLIVPTEDVESLEIFAYNDSDGAGVIGECLYQSDSPVPVIMRCNISELHSNTMIHITSADSVLMYSPSVFLMDGTAALKDGGYLLVEQYAAPPEYEEEQQDLYLDALVKCLGSDYMMGRSVMRSTGDNAGGEYIDDYYCAVYAVGTDIPEQFIVEEWFAVSSNAESTIYIYDILTDSWNEFESVLTPPASTPFGSLTLADEQAITDCIYMLSVYLDDTYGIEYQNGSGYARKAIFKEGQATDLIIPDQLIGENDEIPSGYEHDPLERTYYPVVGFANFQELQISYGMSFTQHCMQTINEHLMRDFLEYDDMLFFVLGGRDYNSISLDFNSLDYSELESNQMVSAELYLYGAWYGNVDIYFDWSEGYAKIASFYFYD